MRIFRRGVNVYARTLIFLVGVLMTVLGYVSPSSAHRLDEYLQAAQISIRPTSIAIDLYLTPGVDVASSILDKIDTNHDGVVSVDEGTEYANAVLKMMVLSIDGRRLFPTLVASDYPSIDDIRAGLGAIHIQAMASLSQKTDGHHVVRFENHFEPKMSDYLANAMLPEDHRIAIRSQDRDTLQSRIDIAYDVAPIKSSLSRLLWFFVGGLALAGGLLWTLRRRSRLL